MNAPLAVTVAQEFCMPAFDQAGGTVVAFFKRQEMQFCIPTDNEQDTINLALRFQDLFVRAIERYESMRGIGI